MAVGPEPTARAPAVEEATGRRAGVRRAAWGAADQGVYGLTNIVLAIMVAQSVDRQAFGAFSAVLVLYTVTIGVVQGLVSEVFSVTRRTNEGDVAPGNLSAAAGCSVALGLGAAALALSSRLVGSGPLVASLTAFAVVVPALYLQDTWRFALFAMGMPRRAFFNDLAWAVVQTVALITVRVSHRTSVSAFILAWGAGAVAGALLGMFQTHTVPRPWMAWGWLRRHWGLGGRFAGEFLTLFGAAQLVLGVVVVAGGYGELARLRAGQVLFAPLQGLLNAVRLAVTSLAVEVWVRTPHRLWRFALGIGLALGGAAVVSGIAAVLVPDRLGRRLLGASWTGVGPVLAPLAVLNAGAALGLGAVTALRAMRASRESLGARTIVAALSLVAGTIGAITAGAVGAACGLAISAILGLVLVTVVAHRTFVARLAARQSPLLGGAAP